MCILICENNNNKFILGFNRDDNISRVGNKIYNSENIFYPVDKIAGGTWIGNNSKGEIIVLLNGEGLYNKGKETRGNIIPNILKGKESIESIESIAKNYNPFQLFYFYKGKSTIIYSNGNDIKKEFIKGNFRKIITSSSYGNKIKENRKLIGENIIKKLPELNEEKLKNILNNKNYLEIGISKTTMKMRGENSQTLSTSIIEFDKKKLEIKHSYNSILNDKYVEYITKII